MFLLAFAGCDVHEFPEERHNKIPFLLHLDFNTEMPLHKEMFYTRNGETGTNGASEKHNIRYIVNAYRTDNIRGANRIADTTFVFAKSDISNLNYTARLLLQEGTYDFKVWADYVDATDMEDKYYDTRDFSEIILANKNDHQGSNDYRDAFRGYVTATVTDPAYYTGSVVDSIDNQATAEMKRPMGKFKFVSTDLDVFPSYVAQIMRGRGILSKSELQSINIEDFHVVFRYNAFMPCSFNMFTDKPADSWMGMSFKSNMYKENDTEMTLGFDYIFVNGTETTLSVSVEVYDNNGNLMSSSNPVDVPVVRSKLTVVKGEFLTSIASGGVQINPGFDGEDYNIELKW